MRIRSAGVPLAILTAIATTRFCQATITTIDGRAEASIQEFRDGVAADFDEALEDFPGTSPELPLQVVARLLADDGEIAGAVVASQFADPRTVAGPNPQEFAINMSLDSVTPATRYTGRAKVDEVRSVVFNPGELGDQPAGTRVDLVGRLTIEGTLAMFSSVGGRDLTGARVTLLVTVVQNSDDVQNRIVFSGQVILTGTSNGGVQVATTGQFPSSTLILSDLSESTPDLFTFQVLILPNIPIDYSYDAVIGEPLTLTATLQVDAENVGDNVGVAALLGTPTDLLAEVIAATKGDATAKALLNALADERAAPTGELAFPPPPPLCGLFALETFLPMLLVPAMLRRRRRT